MDNTYLAFISVAALLVASPGPDSILVIKNALGGGFARGAMTVIGIQFGVCAHALLSVAGLSALLYYSPAAFRALALAGSLYLAHLGLMTLRYGIAPAADTSDTFNAANAAVADAPRGKVITSRRAFMQGMLCNLLNPKVIVLFIAIIPTFVVFGNDDEQRQIIALTLTLIAINLPFQLLLARIAGQFNALLASPRAGVFARALLGGLLLLFAALLFVEHALRYTR